MKKSLPIVCVLTAGAVTAAIAAASAESPLVVNAANAPAPLIVTASNSAQENRLLAFDTTGAPVQSVSTQGQGGASANAGGIAVNGAVVAVVNFGSGSVSLFERRGNGFVFSQQFAAYSAPVSVAFGKDHLYVLGTSTVESHRLRADGVTVDASSDGYTALLAADGSSAQVGVVGNELIVTEKSNVTELVPLLSGAVAGPAVPASVPGSSDTPFGLTTRGDAAYVTFAHSDEVTVIRNGSVVASVPTSTGFPDGDGQHAPCWIAIAGPYLFTSNSPSHSISRLVGGGRSLTLDAPVAATTAGAPIDIAVRDRLLAVVEDDGNGQAHLTQFLVDEDGDLLPRASTAIAAPANGIGIVQGN
jgi:hypothetical protein